MAKATRTRRRVHSRRVRPRPYKFQSSSNRIVTRNVCPPEDCSKCIEKRDKWENVICSVCMECPHNAVLLLCSSHDKGCRPYMCGTSFRYSNCLDQYKKASAKLKSEVGDHLTCPLCRGQVKGWTIVQPAREYLNLKKRMCMQESCAFAGTFRELRKHMRVEHPCARPREVDPDVEQNWRRLEIEHDRDDVFSTIRSLIPGATVLGDYVIERNNNNNNDDDDDGNGFDSDEGGGGDHYNGSGMDAGFGRNFLNVILMMHAVGASRNQTRRSDSDSSDLGINRGTANEMSFSGDEEEEDRQSTSLASRMRRQGRVLLGRSGRRRRDREANQRAGPRR